MKLKYQLGDRVLYKIPAEIEGPREYEAIGTINFIKVEISTSGTNVLYQVNDDTMTSDAFILGRVEIIKDKTTTTRSSKKRGRPQKQGDLTKANSTNTNGSGSGIDYHKVEVCQPTPPPSDLL